MTNGAFVFVRVVRVHVQFQNEFKVSRGGRGGVLKNAVFLANWSGLSACDCDEIFKARVMGICAVIELRVMVRDKLDGTLDIVCGSAGVVNIKVHKDK